MRMGDTFERDGSTWQVVAVATNSLTRRASLQRRFAAPPPVKSAKTPGALGHASRIPLDSLKD
jgi:hypothetical protein